MLLSAMNSSRRPQPILESRFRKMAASLLTSWLREGEARGTNHPIYFRYEVVKTYRQFERQAKLGLCPQGAGRATSEYYNNLSESNITRWTMCTSMWWVPNRMRGAPWSSHSGEYAS